MAPLVGARRELGHPHKGVKPVSTLWVPYPFNFQSSGSTFTIEAP
jgi:hypothetical protein